MKTIIVTIILIACSFASNTFSDEIRPGVFRTPDERFENLKDYPFAPHYLEVDSHLGKLRMHYVDVGPQDADPILLMHGEPSWSYLYRKMIPPLVAAGHRVIAPDLIGFGKSDKPAKRTDHSYPHHVDWVMQFVTELDLKNITLFCQDWGSLIGLRIVTGAPDRFARVVAGNAALPAGKGMDGVLIGGEWTQPDPKAELKWEEGFMSWVKYSQTVPKLDCGFLLQEATVSELSEAELDAYRAPFPDECYMAGARVMPTMVRSQSASNREAWKVLAAFEKPFLTTFSDRDPVTKGGERVFQNRVPGAKGQPHTIIKNAGHFLQEDAPEQLAKVINNLIAETSDSIEPWRFILLSDWHGAEIYVQPDLAPGMEEQLLAGMKMLKENYGGEFILMPGDACRGHWDTPQFIKRFNPELTPAEAILQAGDLCYGGMVDAFKEAGYSRILMAVGDHEVGDNPWPTGTAVSRHQAEFRQTFARGLNRDPEGGNFLYEKPIGKTASRPLGTKYEETSFAYQHKNVLFVTVDVFHQEDPDRQIGPQGSVTGTVVGKHLEWFDQVLSEARKDHSIRHIFVQAHLPVLQPVRRVNSSGMLLDGEMESDFWKTMRKHEVDIYFAGEVHSNTVTKDPKSDLVQVVTRGRYINNFATVDVRDELIDLTLYNQISPKAGDGKFEEYGKLFIDKSSGTKTFRDEGEFTFLDREAPMIHFDFEENFAMKDRIVLGFSLFQGGNPFKSEVDIEGVTCDRSLPNRGAFGRNYDAQNGNIELAPDGPRGKAGVFNPKSQMAVYGAGPYSYGNVVSYALWLKTTSEEDMVLINTGRGGLKRGLMNLNLRDAVPELLVGDDARLIARSQKLNDGKWHHIAMSMHGKECKLSEVQFYVDGKPVESEIVGKDTPINVSMVNKVSVGGGGHDRSRSSYEKLLLANFGVRPFEGSLDEIYVWARALKAEEVAELAK